MLVLPEYRECLYLDLLQAYYEARRHKRSTYNALKFELDFEHNLFELCNELLYGKYVLKPSICFTVNKPVKREIFAAHFRDRVVHHYIIRKLNGLFEKSFINDSYSCRKGKGTLYGIKRVDRFMRKASINYSRQAYVLKLDIQGFFMSINKSLLLKLVTNIVQDRYIGYDKDLLLYLVNVVIMSDPTQNCIIKGSKSDWVGLPHNKSLFHSAVGCGLPIGNLTSQVFANVYLTAFDRFIKKRCYAEYYGRYVDDFVLVGTEKQALVSAVPEITEWLKRERGLVLHPRKVYLQYIDKGLAYIGAVIYPYFICSGRRTKGNLYDRLKEINGGDADNIGSEKICCTLNSYIGMMRHYKAFRFTSSAIENMMPVSVYQHVAVNDGFYRNN